METREARNKKEIDCAISEITSNNAFNKEVSIVVVPQLQLSTYVFCVLNHNISLIKGAVIVIYPVAFEMPKLIYNSSKKFFSLDVVQFHERHQDGAIYLLNKIKDNNLKLHSVVLHPFAGSINREILDQILQRDIKVKYYFYADGSRNNFNLEWNRNNEENMIDIVAKKKQFTSVYSFGYDTSDTIETKRNLSKITVIDYGYMDFIFTHFKHNIKSNLEKNKKYNLVLSRYWGRDPYLFKNDDLQVKAYWKSIDVALSSKQNDIIYRGDNRSTVVTLASSIIDNVKLIDFSSVFAVQNTRHERLLMENFIHEEPNFLKKIVLIYVFDSSFPLIFQSKKLYKLLPYDTVIVVGFDYESVFKDSTNNTLAVMMRRVATLIYDLLNLNIFRIYDKNRLITKDMVNSYHDILKYFKDNDGFFYIQKS
ncbi:hypothetical protein EDC55_12017 [Allofrancisella inopinata]|uniref:Uncharacterized protein n=1 Tax=Allofrancisella inopinata TaxID=1085647 RepID=A0AAE6YKD5_9GAMM|nr:hypothetical protein [Allofrancisella inopinata]QIV96504.1 hypothetical protein E4K63_06540 [Allofrancisella inopinata]TDT68502.1 hypothetical protein EDC55_12017 [Allofrancisella inopinata]